jgi:hypothetical protein
MLSSNLIGSAHLVLTGFDSSETVPSWHLPFSASDYMRKDGNSSWLRYGHTSGYPELELKRKSFASGTAGQPSCHLAPCITLASARASVSNASSKVSSCSGIEDGIDLAEGCLVYLTVFVTMTKTIKYTHQLGHWANAVRSDDPEPNILSNEFVIARSCSC